MPEAFSRKSILDKTIEDAHKQMESLTADDEDYGKMVKHLSELYKIKNNSSNRVSMDTLALIASNLAVTLLILNHERLHPIVTKALSFQTKLR